MRKLIWLLIFIPLVCTGEDWNDNLAEKITLYPGTTIYYNPDTHSVEFSTAVTVNGDAQLNGNLNGNGVGGIFDICDFSACGSVDFVGDHHQYAEIYIATGTVSITLTTQNQWYQVTTLVSTSVTRGLTANGNEIQISTGGVYEVSFGGTWSCSAKDKTVEFGLFKNNMATEFGNIRMVQLTNGANTYNNTMRTGKVTLSVGDSLEVWVRCTCSGGNSVKPYHFNLSVNKL